jgi:hypothetical protein
MVKKYQRQCKYCGKKFEPEIDSQGKRKPIKYCSNDCRKKQEYKVVYGVRIVDVDFKDKTIPQYKTRINSNGVEWVMHVIGMETYNGALKK